MLGAFRFRRAPVVDLRGSLYGWKLRIAARSIMSGRPKRKAVEDTEQKAKRARGETDLPHDEVWSEVGEEIKGVRPLIKLTSPTLAPCSKVAGFDIDFTIIRTASGRKFASGSNDWEFWDDCVPEKLRTLDKDGYRVVFFTNQAGIEKGKVKPREIMTKIEAIITDLGIPVFVFIATGTNHYRKPSTKMWDYFVENHCKGVKLDLSECIYVGDAAGRPKDWAPGKPKDFSCTDRMFAANIGIKFQTPDEFFLGESPAPFEWGSIDPQKYLKANPASSEQKYHKKGVEVVIMVGVPASGKSSFRKKYLEPQGYVAVNRDTMGTMDKCLKAAREALKSGKSVVVDNTNPSKSARKDFIDLAKKQRVPCRCIWLQTPLEVAQHLNQVRQNLTNGKVRRVPDVGYNVYKKNFEEPTTKEGFSEVIKLNFDPSFDNDHHKQLFLQWTSGH